MLLLPSATRLCVGRACSSGLTRWMGGPSVEFPLSGPPYGFIPRVRFTSSSKGGEGSASSGNRFTQLLQEFSTLEVQRQGLDKLEAEVKAIAGNRAAHPKLSDQELLQLEDRVGRLRDMLSFRFAEKSEA
eukprot:RCo040813